jgi:predicted ArsR family transcriptional regulator
MQGPTFRQRLLDRTRGQILTLFRSAPQTVNDLADALKLTDNAVRAHLISLDRDGLVRARACYRASASRASPTV